MSVVDQTETLVRELQDSRARLCAIWHRVGFDDEEQARRCAQLYHHLSQLLEDMETEEAQMEKLLGEETAKMEATLETLSRELGEEVPSLVGLKPAALLEQQRKHMATLEAAKQERLHVLASLLEDDARLASALGLAPLHQPRPGALPSQQELALLNQRLEQRREEQETRQERFSAGRQRLRTLLHQLGKEPESEGGDFVAQLLAEDALLPLSSANLHALDSLLDQVEAEYAEHVAAVRARISDLLQRLRLAWDRCYVPDTLRRHLPQLQDAAPESLFQLYEAEVEKWNKYYQEREAIYKKTSEWQELWNQKVRYEMREKDPNRYVNRGGNLAKELKARERLESRDLPAAEKELAEMMGAWRLAHPGQHLGLDSDAGDPLLHIRRTKHHHAQEREREKAERENRKRNENARELVYGSRPTLAQKAARCPARNTSSKTSMKTPIKTPTKTPSKKTPKKSCLRDQQQRAQSPPRCLLGDPEADSWSDSARGPSPAVSALPPDEDAFAHGLLAHSSLASLPRPPFQPRQ